MATSTDTLTRKDYVAIGVIVVLSVVAQALAAAYFEARGSLTALGASALVFLLWVLVRFWPRA